MIAKELINQMIPPLKLTDAAEYAMLWFDEFRTKELPVVDNGKFIGLITEEQIIDDNDETKLIGDFELEFEDCTVREDQFFYDVIKVAVENKIVIRVMLEAKTQALMAPVI